MLRASVSAMSVPAELDPWSQGYNHVCIQSGALGPRQPTSHGAKK